MDALREHVIRRNASLECWDGVPGLTLRFDFLAEAGANPELLHQWRHGRVLEPSARPAKRARNHPSVAAQAEWAEREWARLEAAGKIEFFPAGAPKPPELNVNPCGLILKEREGAGEDEPDEVRLKPRLIVDLRRGCVNQSLPDVGVHYGTLDQAVSRLAEGSWMFVLDLQDCFFNWRIDPADSMLLGFYSPSRNQFGKYNFLPFGLKPAPGINDASVKEILRLLKRRRQIDLLDFVDDLLGSAASEIEAWGQMAAAVDFLLDCGLPVSSKPSGIRQPATSQTWIGWIFDTRNALVTVSQSKCDKCCQACAAVLEADSSRSLLSRQLASAAGRASHLAELWPQARRRLHPVWSDLNAAGVYAAWQSSSSADPPVRLSEQSRAAFQWILAAFARPPARLLFCGGGSLSSWGPKSQDFQNWENLASQGAIRVIATDASKTHGWSYHVCSDDRVVSGEWPADFADAERHPHAGDINYKELWVACECLRRERSVVRGWRVLFRMDHTPAIHYVNFRYGRIPHLESLSARLESAERAACCWALAVHLPGRLNVIADAGSRDSSFGARWAADAFKDATLRPALFREVEGRCGVAFTIDLFAHRSGSNSLAPQWRCPEMSAFECDLSGHVAWAHPPRALARECLAHFNRLIKADPALRIVLLLPEDPGAPWFRSALLAPWYRVRSWDANSDIFRWFTDDGSARRGPKSDLRYSVLQSWQPARRLR